MRTHIPCNTRDRSVTHSLQIWVSTKSSISQVQRIFIFIILCDPTKYARRQGGFKAWLTTPYTKTSIIRWTMCMVPTLPVAGLLKVLTAYLASFVMQFVRDGIFAMQGGVPGIPARYVITWQLLTVAKCGGWMVLVARCMCLRNCWTQMGTTSTRG